MTTTQDGGPAFPSPLEWRETSALGTTTSGVFDNGHDGMSLRDYFAAQTIVAVVTDMREDADGATLREQAIACADALARAAYRIADAMLAARATGSGSGGAE